MTTSTIPARVITVSDRSAAGLREDASGPLAQEILRANGYQATTVIVADGADSVHDALVDAIESGARLIITTGGTGVTPTDRTPEGTWDVLDRELPGISELLRAQACKRTPYGALTRGLAGTTDSTPERPGALIVNLPGKPAAVRESLDVLLPLVPHILDQLVGGDH